MWVLKSMTLKNLKVVLREISITAEVSYLLALHLCLPKPQAGLLFSSNFFLTLCNCSQSHCGDFTIVSISQIARKLCF